MQVEDLSNVLALKRLCGVVQKTEAMDEGKSGRWDGMSALLYT